MTIAATVVPVVPSFGRSPSGSQSSFIIGHRHVSIPHAEWGGLLNRPKYGDFHRRPNIFESLVLALRDI